MWIRSFASVAVFAITACRQIAFGQAVDSAAKSNDAVLSLVSKNYHRADDLIEFNYIKDETELASGLRQFNGHAIMGPDGYAVRGTISNKPANGTEPEEFLAYSTAAKRGYWSSRSIIGNEVISAVQWAAPDNVTAAARLTEFMPPDPIRAAIGDGELTLEQLCSRYRRFPQRLNGNEPEAILSLMMTDETYKQERYPFLKATLHIGGDLPIELIERYWSASVVSERFQAKSIARATGNYRIQIATEWTDEKYREKPIAGAGNTVYRSHTQISNGKIASSDALSDLSLFTLFGGVPVNVEIARTFDNGSQDLIQKRADNRLAVITTEVGHGGSDVVTVPSNKPVTAKRVLFWCSAIGALIFSTLTIVGMIRAKLKTV